ncbi:tRNA methyltransferase complex GCD14 subunit [Xylona heveae TC161]|uniref:tRNA (adenine(58)-N(1))-methyltransferase catalytic subunit TRM61 n=1 Tax=Xylona heveae (strain CBS 132557 / TC161) TaxID=1328760 RepID=A0A165AFV1_XYLHT|nr:tRNA methyltransferase complex GCD14 subunit [Xylona heveae TC161]KZF20407.1 tRNA methyltransferase complex GCD14 subunit [Xylona heveae TC161]
MATTDPPLSFLDPGDTAQAQSIAILHLKRDLLMPTRLQEQDELNEGYDEGKVTNTRFGSFPHSTLIGQSWGSQIRASAVDTGSRGRRPKNDKKRKRDEDENTDSNAPTPKTAVAASTGFVHLLPPTPETWTSSLPHRTQVVYTPDYSYILHRLRVRPGTVLIEAGAGSGSFTHASARAVYDGLPGDEVKAEGASSKKKQKKGKIYSYEFHEQRVGKLKTELYEHGLDGLVEITHRDVCNEGFMVRKTESSDLNAKKNDEPKAEAIFLDLPAPWLALRHLTRNSMSSKFLDAAAGSSNPQSPAPGGDLPPPAPTSAPEGDLSFHSPLNPKATIRICTFSPCMEQVQRTISTMRQLGWVEIEMVEVQHKRLEVRRERVGLHEEGLRGVTAMPASVDEAVSRLREVEGRFRSFHGKNTGADGSEDASGANATESKEGTPASTPATYVSKQQRQQSIRDSLADRKVFKEGRLVHRTEPEIRTHTSYLVFALLPREWTAEDEARCQKKWPIKEPRQPAKNKDQKARSGKDIEVDAGGRDVTQETQAANGQPISRRQMKKLERAKAKNAEREKEKAAESEQAATEPTVEDAGAAKADAAGKNVEEPESMVE